LAGLVVTLPEPESDAGLVAKRLVPAEEVKPGTGLKRQALQSGGAGLQSYGDRAALMVQVWNFAR
jgi:hypothetical protein